METNENKSRGIFFVGLLWGIALATAVGVVVIILFGPGLVQRKPINVDTSSGIENGDGILTDATEAKVEAMRETIHEYFYQEVTDEELTDAMLHGMIDALDDKYSAYYSAEEWKATVEGMSGSFVGIGVYVEKDEVTGYVRVLKIIKGTPAEKYGLQSGDLIMKADDVELSGLNLDNAVAQIRGDQGTEVKLTLLRDSEVMEVTVVRDKVLVDTVEYELLEDGIAYIAIQSFDEITAEQFKKALRNAYSDQMKGLIIDLRGNGGGYLDVVTEILQQILPKGIITYTVDKNGLREDYECDGTKELSVPLVLLTDGYTASASELFAGAVRDYNKGLLVGTKTYGKGIVQVYYPFSDGTCLKLTNSAYYTPSGQCIHEIGIEPDIEVPFDGVLYMEQNIDNQLERAIEEMQNLIN